MAPNNFNKTNEVRSFRSPRETVFYLLSRQFLLVDESCLENCKTTIALLTKLGFIINYKKSKLTSSQERTFLSFTINSHLLFSILPEPKQVFYITRLFPTASFNWRNSRGRGTWLANLQAMIMMPLLTTLQDFHWRLRTLSLPSSVQKPRFSSFAAPFSDASDIDWGVSFGSMKTHWWWSNEGKKDIIFTELKAVDYALRSLANDIRDQTLHIRIDNTRARSHSLLTYLLQKLTQNMKSLYPGFLILIAERLSDKAFWRKNTRFQCWIQRWHHWLQERWRNIRNQSGSQQNNFATYGTLNSYRSALALIIDAGFGTDKSIKRFCRGTAILKPSKPKYDSTWDPLPVVSYSASFKPHDKLSLELFIRK